MSHSTSTSHIWALEYKPGPDLDDTVPLGVFDVREFDLENNGYITDTVYEITGPADNGDVIILAELGGNRCFELTWKDEVGWGMRQVYVYEGPQT